MVIAVIIKITVSNISVYYHTMKLLAHEKEKKQQENE